MTPLPNYPPLMSNTCTQGASVNLRDHTLRKLALFPFLVRSPGSPSAHTIYCLLHKSKSQMHWEPQACVCLYSARPTKMRTALLSIRILRWAVCMQSPPWSCWHLASLAVTSVRKSLLPLNPFPKHFSSKPCLTKTIPLQLGTARCSQKQGSVNFKVSLWRRVLSNADVKGNRWEGNMSSAPPPACSWMLPWKPLMV